MLTIDFEVHNAAEVPMSVAVEHDGAEVQATVQCLEVELVSVKEKHGSLTLRFSGAEFAPAKELFVPGHTVSWTL